MNLIIDIGNTRVKTAVFEGTKVVEVFIFKKRSSISELKKIKEKYSISHAILSSVSKISEIKKKKMEEFLNVVSLTALTKVPFFNLYKTPNTLGVDRIALVANAVVKFSNKNVLIIDAGTCITYDFVNSNKEYLGGAISPGVEMRFKSLHAFTSKLPKLNAEVLHNITGASTQESINSGVVNGIIQEIEGVINQYQNKYLDLTVVLTGGDTNFLSKQLKSSIFANQNFLLEGLNEILIFNKDK
ncbi:type III pantothenate kinase [Polaribacter sp. WD7]|uniref:type III pantothenate kinase n=1 Tax=Polaribacter sp. WD7 TaxID=2269061 RepID=UPI000DF1E450|nr:type III pantothenate kinase [Polaribacter sp. WD7]RCS26474.1 type III pantothenate kinase [Polaribacter sp. WD7]